MVLAYLICIIIFPRALAITSMLIIIFSDSAAAIFGRVYGKHYIYNKTIEGSLAFLFTGLIVILISPKVTNFIGEYYIAIAAIIATTFFEIIPLKINDNLSIPIFFWYVVFNIISNFLIIINKCHLVVE